jgi:hypothetical protein
MSRQLPAKAMEAYGLMRLGDPFAFPSGTDCHHAAGRKQASGRSVSDRISISPANTDDTTLKIQ